MNKSISKKNNDPTVIYIRECHTLFPNNDDSNEISVIIERYGDTSDIELVFTPQDWLDTFTPTMYEHVKKNYIKYLTDKK